MTELVKRLKSETPLFFKKLIKICLWAGGGAFAVLAANKELDLALPQLIIDAMKCILTGSIFAGGTGMLPIKDKSESTSEKPSE